MATRCMNCGADRTGQICNACGLTDAAAEVILKRRLLNRTAFFLLGALAFIFASSQYPPLDSDGVLISTPSESRGGYWLLAKINASAPSRKKAVRFSSRRLRITSAAASVNPHALQIWPVRSAPQFMQRVAI